LIKFQDLFIKMGWGGRRKGAGRKLGSKNPRAGRKPGSLNKLTRVVVEEQTRILKRTGKWKWPHEILLRICRGERIGNYQPTPADQIKAAKAAAPYYAPRLRAVVKAPSDQDEELLNLTDRNRGRP